MLLIHGFAMCPQEMRFLAERLRDAGFAVSVPRLPGHGTDGRDFLSTGWRDWLGACREARRKLRASHGEPFLCGISMGALLAILLAAESSPPRIALVAPAVVTRKAILLAPVIGLFVKRFPAHGEWPQATEDDAWFEREYWSWRYPRQIASVWKLQRLARKALPRVKSAVLTVVSEKDPTVPPAAADLVERRIGSARTSRLTLRESPHRILTGIEKEAACARIVEWFSGAATEAPSGAAAAQG